MTQPPDTAIDWFRLLWDLIQRGHTLQSVSDRTGIARKTLCGYIDGSHPAHWRGEKLIVIWCQACDRRREEVPVCEVYKAPRVARSDIRVDDEALGALERGMR